MHVYTTIQRPLQVSDFILATQQALGLQAPAQFTSLISLTDTNSLGLSPTPNPPSSIKGRSISALVTQDICIVYVYRISYG